MRPQVSSKLQPLLEQLEEAITGPSFLKAEWYWTKGDYRAKLVSGQYSRVFFVLRVAQDHFRGGVKDKNDKDVWFEISSFLDFKNHREEIEAAYKRKLPSVA
jgi:hypothetical protein